MTLMIIFPILNFCVELVLLFYRIRNYQILFPDWTLETNVARLWRLMVIPNLPTNKSDSEYRHRDCHDVVHDIIERYKPSHTVVLCGDLNGSLLVTRNNKHDVILKYFIKNHCLSNGTFDSNQPTFYHFNGNVTSKIDYVLSSEPKNLATFDILKRESMNVSTHAPIKVALRIGLDNENIRLSTKAKPQAKTVLSWNQIDLEKYSIELRRPLSSRTGS